MSPPEWDRALADYKTHHERILTVHFSTGVGLMEIVATHAPHAGRSRGVLKAYWDLMTRILQPFPRPLLRMVVGDLNVRWQCRRDGEETILGPWVRGWGEEHLRKHISSGTGYNREICAQIMHENGLVHANSQFRHPLRHVVTFRENNTTRGVPFKDTTYTTLDHYLIAAGYLKMLTDVMSFTHFQWSSQHFPVLAWMRIKAEGKR